MPGVEVEVHRDRNLGLAACTQLGQLCSMLCVDLLTMTLEHVCWHVHCTLQAQNQVVFLKRKEVVLQTLLCV